MTGDRPDGAGWPHTGVDRWLRQVRGPDAGLRSLTRARSGYANETLVITVEPDGERLVLRLAPERPLFPEYDFAGQAEVHRWAADHGVPAPVPVLVEDDRQWLGRPFLAMPFVEGRVPSETPASDPWIAGSSPGQQAVLRHSFMAALAGIHQVPGSPTLARGLDAEVRWWADYLAWAVADRQVATAADAFAWCEANRPATPATPSLLWGDVRLGNVIFGDDREVRAILDWDMASAGPAEVDLGYLYAIEDVQEQLFGQRVPGFPSRQDELARHESGLGRPLDDLGWYETFGLARAVAVNLRQAVLAGRAGSDPTLPADESNPLVRLLGRRLRNRRS